MNLNIRIFLTFSLVLGLAILGALYQFLTEIKPGVRQSAEHTLVDTAQLLAELVITGEDQTPLADPKMYEHFSQAIQRFLERHYSANIYTIAKGKSELRVYVTDHKGIVLFDSKGLALGQDYSQWNDVYLTLLGKYGARTTQEDPNHPASTTMYVAAPIKQAGKIVGVLTVGKPNILSQPFIDLAQTKLKRSSIILGAIFIFIGAILSFWLTHSIRQLAQYAKKVAAGERAKLPAVREKELKQLGYAMESMRKEVEGKDYIEKYVLALTHEIKSPVTAIRGAAELVTPEMPTADRTNFIGNIRNEAQRIENLINRLLSLASLEIHNTLTSVKPCQLAELITKCVTNKQPICHQRQVTIHTTLTKDVIVNADVLLLTQAIDNVLMNALDFSPPQSEINISLSKAALPENRALQTKNDDSPNPQATAVSSIAQICIQDQGPGIPKYAQKRVFERFYSLPRPDTGQKSSGLGLSFVKQVMELHEGCITLHHSKQGLRVNLELPCA